MAQVTWETATDWDNAQSESGVVHESVVNTDHNDATVVKQGYEIANPYLNTNLIGYWPLQEDSGSTAYDFSGSNNDGTVNGATLNATGLLDTSAYDLDGLDDGVAIPNYSKFSSYSLLIWFNADSLSYSVEARPLSLGGSNQCNLVVDHADYPQQAVFQHNDGNNDWYQVSSNNDLVTGDWYLMAGTWDGSTMELYINGVSQGTASVSSLSSTTGNDTSIGYRRGNNDLYFDGRVANAAIYNTALSSAQIQTYYDVVTSRGSLTTVAKTS